MIDTKFNELGWTSIPSLYNREYIDFAKQTINSLYPKYNEIQKKGGVFSESENCLHHIAVFCPELVEKTFNDKLINFLLDYFQGKFILNAFGSTGLLPKGKTYTQKPHRDARDIHSSKDMLNLVILLDDSTSQNGATKLIEGSHLTNKIDDYDNFNTKSISINGNAGDLIIFNPYLLHSTGVNVSDKSRTIITAMVTRPFIKSQMDYVRAIKKHFSNLYFESCSDLMKQLFGYYSRVPESFNEFYVTKDLRSYRSDQF